MNGSVGSLLRAVAVFDSKVEATSHAAWDMPSPCEGWTAADVLRHCTENVRGVTAALLGGDFRTARQLPVDGDLVAAWRTARDSLSTAHTRLEPPPTEVLAGGNVIPARLVIDGVMRDLVIHSWDVARATGADEAIPEDAVGDAIEAMALVTDAQRGPGGYGPARPHDGDADALAQLLAMSGRDS